MIVFIILIGFSYSFWLVGQNQKEAVEDYFLSENTNCKPIGKNPDECELPEGPEYAKWTGSLKHVYLLALGEFGLD